MKTTLAKYFVALPRSAKVLIVAGVDFAASVVGGWMVLSFEARAVVLPDGSAAAWLALFATLQILVLWQSSAYKAVSRFIGFSSLARSVQYLVLLFIPQALLVLLWQPVGLPLAFSVVQPALFLSAFLASRFLAARFLGLADKRSLKEQDEAFQALIYGAGEAGRELAMGLAYSSQFRVVGFVDEDISLEGAVIQGLHVHPPGELLSLVQNRQVTHVLLAMPSITRSRRAQVVKGLAGVGVKVMTLPSLSDLAHGRVSVQDLREIDIEDLLGRETTKPNEILLNKDTRGKVVMVTGAGGSIGSEICRQVLERQPLKLILVEVSEPSLYLIESELSDSFPNILIEAVLCNVQDAAALQQVMIEHRPDTFYHAAAYKHVPLVEANECAGVLNNVLGTLNCAKAATEAGVSKFTLISTDKAVRPTNVMGATKRVAEMVLQALSAQGGKTQFSMVRFGNVLGSSGSVVPRFRQQIEEGGPITLTHQEITRYFMTIPEATELVLQAGAMGGAGEVFVLDMGEPVKIIDLAYRMVELSGLRVKDESTPDGDISVEITGLRPGEKLYEELLIGNNPQATPHPGIFMAREEFLSSDELMPILNRLLAASTANQAKLVRIILQELVTGYQPEAIEIAR